VQFVRNTSGSPLPDNSLLEQYKQTDDLEALGALFDRYLDLVYGVCLKYLKDVEAAKDSTLDIFEQLLTKLRKHEVEHFKPWLYQLAKNHCLMLLRSEKKWLKVASDTDLMQNENIVHLNGELEKEENLEQLEKCMAELNQEQRQVVSLFYLEQKSYKEIVEVTGMDWNLVRSYVQNGRRNLKICMEKHLSKSDWNG
jgi:RNA polymerase sigma-70 factor (ECF subfamily)